MTGYKHTKVVDDDVRQEIGAVLRKNALHLDRDRGAYSDMLQELGELYMRERWGVKGDMHAQSGYADGYRKRAYDAERDAKIAKNDLRREQSILATVSKRCEDAIVESKLLQARLDRWHEQPVRMAVGYVARRFLSKVVDAAGVRL